MDFSSYFFLEVFFIAEAVAAVGSAQLGQSDWHTLKSKA